MVYLRYWSGKEVFCSFKLCNKVKLYCVCVHDNMQIKLCIVLIKIKILLHLIQSMMHTSLQTKEFHCIYFWISKFYFYWNFTYVHIQHSEFILHLILYVQWRWKCSVKHLSLSAWRFQVCSTLHWEREENESLENPYLVYLVLKQKL